MDYHETLAAEFTRLTELEAQRVHSEMFGYAHPSKPSKELLELVADAMRFRALTTGSLRNLGSSGLNCPDGLNPNGTPHNGYAHLGLELWTRYGSDQSDKYANALDERTESARQKIRRYTEVSANYHFGNEIRTSAADSTRRWSYALSDTNIKMGNYFPDYANGPRSVSVELEVLGKGYEIKLSYMPIRTEFGGGDEERKFVDAPVGYVRDIIKRMERTINAIVKIDPTPDDVSAAVQEEFGRRLHTLNATAHGAALALYFIEVIEHDTADDANYALDA